MSSAEPDLALLQRYSQDRDEEAFAEIVRRYAGLVFATCQRILHDRAQAEEVSQDTFFRLVRRPDAVTHSLPGWLHKTATRLAIDALRSESSRARREASYTAERDRESTRWQDVSPCVDEALEELDPEQRRLLVEHFLNGRPQQDLAADAGASASTISRRMNQALEALRQKLRSKGLVVGSVGLLAMLLVQNAVQAAPPRLLFELGKMAMVSRSPPVLVGAGHAGPGAATAASAGRAAAVAMGPWPRLVAIVVCVFCLIGLIGLLVAVGPRLWPGSSHPGASGGAAQEERDGHPGRAGPAVAPPVPQTSAKGDSAQEVLVPEPTEAEARPQPDAIERFERPRADSGGVLVRYRDGRSERITLEALRERIRQQTGQSPEDLAARQAP